MRKVIVFHNNLVYIKALKKYTYFHVTADNIWTSADILSICSPFLCMFVFNVS